MHANTGAETGAGGHEHWVTVDGCRIRYLKCPAERRQRETPVLLIHGLLGFSFSWRFNLAALAQDADVYALDLPGVGYSDRPQQMDCSLSGMARTVQRFMDAGGLGRADVIATSHGGGVGIMLAAGAPERVRRLVLVAPVNPWSRHGSGMVRLMAGVAGPLLNRFLFAFGRLTSRRVLARMDGDPRRIPPGTVEAYAAAAALPGTREHLLRIMRCWQADVRGLEAALPKIAHIPTLLLWGSRDTAVDPASGDMLRQRLANSELVVLPGVGHLPYEEAPDQFNEIVAGFLSL